MNPQKPFSLQPHFNFNQSIIFLFDGWINKNSPCSYTKNHFVVQYNIRINALNFIIVYYFLKFCYQLSCFPQLNLSCASTSFYLKMRKNKKQVCCCFCPFKLKTPCWWRPPRQQEVKVAPEAKYLLELKTTKILVSPASLPDREDAPQVLSSWDNFCPDVKILEQT